MFNRVDETSDFRKKREAEAEQIRKTNRDEIFSKRRNILIDEVKTQTQVAKKERLLIVDSRFATQIEAFLRSPYSMEIFPQLVSAFADPDILRQHYAMIGVRKILSIADSPPIQAIIDAGLVPRMIEYVKQSEYPQLQLEATWALTNVASGTSIQCQSIIDKGGIPLFINLLRSSNPGILEQAIWAIGNISSDSVIYRDNILKAGGLINLVAIVDNPDTEPLLVKHSCWALSNLCRGTPLPKFQYVKSAIPALCRAIAQGRITDKEIIADSCWAISYHSDSNRPKIQIVVDSGVVKRIVENLSEPSMALLVPSIRILGNISTGTVEHTNQLMKYDILTPLEKVLEHHKKVVRRESCWVISNIAAGNRNQVESILQREGLIKKVLKLFETDCNDVKREICYVFSNLAHTGQPEIIFQLYINCDIIRYYVNLLTNDEARSVEVALECLFLILGLGEKFKANTGGKNPLVLQLKTLGAIELLEKLQYHKSDTVYENVSKILQAFFEIQDPLEI